MKTQQFESGLPGKIVSFLIFSLFTFTVHCTAETALSDTAANHTDYAEQYLPEPNVYTVLQNNPDSTAYVVVRLRKPVMALSATIEDTRTAIKAVQESVLAELTAEEFRPVHIFKNFASMTGDISISGLEKLAANPDVLSIGLDVGGHGHLDDSVPFINADDVQSLVGLGYTGEGVTVAVLDTGIDSDHPDLKDNIADGWYYFLNKTSGSGAEDDNGHGTNVAGIITSKGTVAPVGVAPDADILAIKVLDDDMNFQYSSDIAAAVDYVVTHKNDYDNLCVINMSLGTNTKFSQCPCDSVGDDPDYTWLGTLRDSLDAANNAGIVIFASSGNDGSCTQMPAPACLSAAAAVAAVYDQDLGREPNEPNSYHTEDGGSWPYCYNGSTYGDLIACFSNRNGCNELAAPGRNIKSSGMGGGTSEYTGTSQAAPHCAAVAALMYEKADYFGTIWPTPAWIVNTMKSTGVATVDNCATNPNPVRVDAFSAVNEFIGSWIGYKYKQPPKTSGYGIDIRCDRLNMISRILADDFVCSASGPITKIVLFSSYYDDFIWTVDTINIRIYDNIPDPDGEGPQISRPGELLWQADFNRDEGEFTESLYYEIPALTIPAKAWWWDPAGGVDPVANNDKKTMRYDILIPPDEAFIQQGAPCEQKTYWLAVYANFKWVLWPMPAFGWKTATTSQNATAVWSNDNGSTWNELKYPPAHPSAGNPIDFSFRIFGNACCRSLDFSGDNKVALDDFADFALDWWLLEPQGEGSLSDLNCDASVDTSDLEIFCSQWLNDCTYNCFGD